MRLAKLNGPRGARYLREVAAFNVLCFAARRDGLALPVWVFDDHTPDGWIEGQFPGCEGADYAKEYARVMTRWYGPDWWSRDWA